MYFRNIDITKKDIVWSYFAQFFSMGSGILVLPFILSNLSADEVGINYLMLTISTFVSLFDFGFSPQFARNITYVFSGATNLQKEGIDIPNNGIIDYKLVYALIQTAKYVYRILSAIVLVTLLTLGTLYVSHVTKGFSSIDNMLHIWLLYCFSVYFNMYFSYYNSLLIGRGLIKESQKASVFSKLLNVLLTVGLVLSGVGLIGLVIANLLSPFLGRYISHRYFFEKNIVAQLKGITVDKKDIKSLFRTLWYNAKRMGLVSLGAYGVSQSGMFLSGLCLSLEEVASFGLMVQLMGVVATISSTIVSVYSPFFASCRMENDKGKLIRRFAFSMYVYYLLFFVGTLVVVLVVPSFLQCIHSNSYLPIKQIVLLYALIRLLETNHSNFALIILSANTVPFMKASLLSGGLIVVGLVLVITLTDWGILGLILIPGIVQLAYQNWKWPKVVCEELSVTYWRFLKIGFGEIKNVYNGRVNHNS